MKFQKWDSKMMYKKPLILGAGFIGRRIHQGIPESILSTTYIHSPQTLIQLIKTHRPDYIINSIGKTGFTSIDWCEQNPEITYYTHHEIPLLIAKVCEEFSLPLVHLSTGCFYSGLHDGRGFEEENLPNFLTNHYLKSKYMAEQDLKNFNNVLSLRLRLPLDYIEHPKNLLTKLKNFKKIIQVKNSITYLPDLISSIPFLVNGQFRGVLNFVNPGLISLNEIAEIMGFSYGKEVIDLKSLNASQDVARSYCYLNTKLLQSLNINLNPIREILVKQFKNSSRFIDS